MAPLPHFLASLALGPRCAHAVTAAVFDGQFGNISEEEWADMFATPNATIEVPFSGYDIIAPYPGSRSDDWRLSVRIKEGIPSDFRDMVAAATWITWGAPKDLMVKNTTNDTYGLAPLHPSWNIAQIIMKSTELRSDDEEVDPTCKGVLSDECINDFHEQLANTYNRAGNRTGSNRFPSAHPPSSCELKLYEAYTTGFPHDLLNRTKEEDGLFDYAKITPGASARHEPGNLTDYDRSIRSVYIMALVWGYSNLTDLTPQTTTPETTIICARANVVEGSRTLKDGAGNPALGGGNGGRTGAMSGLLLLTVGAGFALML